MLNYKKKKKLFKTDCQIERGRVFCNIEIQIGITPEN